MRSLLPTMVFVLIASLWVQPSVGGEIVKKVATDDPLKLGTAIALDPKVKIGGQPSIRISTRWPTVVCLDVVPLNLDNARLMYKAKARCEDLEGTAMLEMWCHVKGSEYFSRGTNSVVTRTMDWTPLQTPFLLQKDQKADHLTLNVLINGKGTIWIGDVTLEREPIQ